MKNRSVRQLAQVLFPGEISGRQQIADPAYHRRKHPQIAGDEMAANKSTCPSFLVTALRNRGFVKLKQIQKSEKNSDWSDPPAYPIFYFFWKQLET